MRNRGSVLIAAVWAVLALSILIANLAFHAGQEILLMKREIKAFRLRLDFSSGLNEAVRMIGEDPEPHEDSRDKPWFGDWRPDEPYSSRLSVRMEDEESKINLNHASAALLSNFFRELESETGPLKGSRKAYLQTILKLRHEKRIDSLEEMLLSDDFEPEDLDAFRTYCTVYPDTPRINPNTASPVVLRALVQSLGADHASKQMLLSRLEEACGRGCFFRSGDLQPGLLAEKLKLPQTPLVMQAVQELAAALMTDSETFHLVMESVGGPQAETVFRCRVGQARPEIFYWHENV